MLVAAFVIDRRGAAGSGSLAGHRGPTYSPRGRRMALSRGTRGDDVSDGHSDRGQRSVSPPLGHASPLELGKSKQRCNGSRQGLARRDGGCDAEVATLAGSPANFRSQRAGLPTTCCCGDIRSSPPDLLALAAKRVSGAIGERLAAPAFWLLWSIARAGWWLPTACSSSHGRLANSVGRLFAEMVEQVGEDGR